MARVEHLTDDVLYLVFCYTLPSFIREDVGSINFWTISPMNLLLVCRSWHAIVASRPSLWSFIVIAYLDPELESHLRPVNVRIFQAVESWLQRSASSSLHVTVNALIHFDNFGVVELFDRIFPHSPRLDEISVNVLDSYPSANHVPVVYQCSPSATAITLAIEFPSGFHDPSPDIFDLSCATIEAHSRLRTLIVQVDIPWRLPEEGTLSFPNLQSLLVRIGASHSVGDVHALFVACPNIVFLEIVLLKGAVVGAMLDDSTGITFQETTAHPRNPCLLSRLRKITFVCGHLDAIAPIVDLLTCQSLNLFTALGPSSFTPHLLRSLRNLFVRSNAQTSLHILFLWAQGRPPVAAEIREELAEAFRSMLRAASSLVSLVTRGFVVNTRLLQDMTLPPLAGDDDDVDVVVKLIRDSSVICPILTHLCFHCSEDEAFEVPPLGTIEAMIESRWQPPSWMLETVEFRVPGVDILEESERLRICREEGLIFSNNDELFNVVT